jgi:hypothetical protein
MTRVIPLGSIGLSDQEADPGVETMYETIAKLSDLKKVGSHTDVVICPACSNIGGFLISNEKYFLCNDCWTLSEKVN